MRGPLSLRGELGNGPLRSDLAAPSLQQWLPDTMVAFAEQTGAGGFSFDYTYFETDNAYGQWTQDQYAQWTGWRKILHRLHTAKGGRACGGDGTSCVVDNRQQNHKWGPWMWVQGGTYAEPLMSDEQPGSWMFTGADLHTDRLAANFERSIAWNYRNVEFCPAEVLPGFAMHQTDRDPTVLEKAAGGQRSNSHARARDFDLLGYRYSVMSSIGTAGLNNVVNMLPARDEQEYALLPAEDIAFVREWMRWTDAHVGWLRNTKTITGLPSGGGGGLLDATAMILDDQGALFVYNPAMSAATLSVTLGRSLGFSANCASTLVVRATGSSNRGFTPYNLATIKCGSQLNVTLPATTAMSFEFANSAKAEAEASMPGACTVFGGVATAHVDWDRQTIVLADMQGPAGEEAELVFVMPSGHGTAQQAATSFTIDGGHPMLLADACAQQHPVGEAPCAEPFEYHGRAAVRVRGRWAGAAFKNEIGTLSGFKGGEWSGEFIVPAQAVSQLVARNKSYPIEYDLDPDGNDDANIPWLAPGRLLVFVKYSPLLNDTLNASGSIDGRPLIMRKAYNTIVRSPGRFIGHWSDVTDHIKPGTSQTLRLTLPEGGGGYHVSDGYIYEGNDLGTANVTIAEAEKHCSTQARCAGFSFEKIYPEDQPPFQCGNITGVRRVRYKAATAGRRQNSPRQTVCTVTKGSSPIGVFFDNVQPMYGKLTPS